MFRLNCKRGSPLRHLSPYATIALLLTMAGCSGAAGNSATSSVPSPSTAKSNTQISGMVLGYAWDTVAQSLRPIQGLPGAAYLGSPIYSGYTSGIASARAGYALLTGTAGDISLALLPTGQPTALTPVFSTHQQIALSPGGAAAVIFAQGMSTALVFTNLPGAPQRQQVPISMPGTITNVSVSDTGLLLVAAASASGGAAISAISADGTVHPVGNVARYGDMRFIASSNDALIADAGQNTLSTAKDVAAGASLLQIASATDGVQNPVAVASSADGRWALVANQGGTLLRIDLTQLEPVGSATCPCVPNSLTPLSGNAVFQIIPLGAGPLWLYEGDAATPRAVFVPATTNGNQG